MKRASLYNQDGSLCSEAQLLLSPKPDTMSIAEWRRLLKQFKLHLSVEELEKFNKLKKKATQENYKNNNPEKIKASRQKSRSNPKNKEREREYQKQYHKNYYKNNKDKCSTYIKKWYDNNKSVVQEYGKAYRKDNNKKIKQQQKDYYKANKEQYELYRKANKKTATQYNKEYWKSNKEKESLRNKEYYKANKEKIIKRSIEYRKSNKEKTNAYSRKYSAAHAKQDPAFKLRLNMRSIATRAVKQLKLGKKPSNTYEMFGCSAEQLKFHIESLFTKGMSWDNHGKYGWHIDHIRPVSSFSQEEIMQVNHHTNLQPLWAKENIKKSNKWCK